MCSQTAHEPLSRLSSNRNVVIISKGIDLHFRASTNNLPLRLASDSTIIAAERMPCECAIVIDV